MKNKKNQKKILIVSIFFILLAIVVFGFLKFSKQNSSPQIVPKALSVENIKISLNVLDKKYETEIKEDASVFEVMKKIEEENMKDNLFNFKYEEFTGLGAFINEINGQKGGENGYWIYYVNNIEASVGVSKYILKSGDIISWK